MKCEDIREALEDDNSDLRQVARHLKSCPACTSRYGEQLDWELSLRGLSEEIAPIDISAELSRQINITNKNIRYLGFLRQWVWVMAGAMALAAIAIGLPTLIDWLGSATNWLAANLPGVESQGMVDLNKWNNELKASSYFYYIMAGIVALIAALLSYLWREFKEII
jgi:hypothetical protein